MVLVTAFLVAVFFNYYKFKNEDTENNTSKFQMKNYFAFIFVWTFMVMFLADMRYPGNAHTEYRYFTIGVVPMIMLFGMQLNSLNKVLNDFQKKMAYIVLLAACIIVAYGNYKNVVEEWNRSAYAKELTEYVDTLDVESLIFVNDPDSAIMCKGIDFDHKYGAYISSSNSMYLGICSYYASGHGSFYGNRHALAVIEGNDIYQCLPPEIAQYYVKVDKFKWFDIYISDVMLLP